MEEEEEEEAYQLQEHELNILLSVNFILCLKTSLRVYKEASPDHEDTNCSNSSNGQQYLKETDEIYTLGSYLTDNTHKHDCE